MFARFPVLCDVHARNMGSNGTRPEKGDQAALRPCQRIREYSGSGLYEQGTACHPVQRPHGERKQLGGAKGVRAVGAGSDLPPPPTGSRDSPKPCLGTRLPWSTTTTYDRPYSYFERPAGHPPQSRRWLRTTLFVRHSGQCCSGRHLPGVHFTYDPGFLLQNTRLDY